jgi:hypothetical protein
MSAAMLIKAERERFLVTLDLGWIRCYECIELAHKPLLTEDAMRTNWERLTLSWQKNFDCATPIR